jgi:hypothetical protein
MSRRGFTVKDPESRFQGSRLREDAGWGLMYRCVRVDGVRAQGVRSSVRCRVGESATIHSAVCPLPSNPPVETRNP